MHAKKMLVLALLVLALLALALLPLNRPASAAPALQGAGEFVDAGRLLAAFLLPNGSALSITDDGRYYNLIEIDPQGQANLQQNPSKVAEPAQKWIVDIQGSTVVLWASYWPESDPRQVSTYLYRWELAADSGVRAGVRTFVPFVGAP